MISEIKKIIKDSEIMKEDDTRWPQKNKDGKQELEIRLGNEHISFEVRGAQYRLPSSSIDHGTDIDRLRKLVLWWTLLNPPTPRDCVSSTTLSRTSRHSSSP